MRVNKEQFDIFLKQYEYIEIQDDNTLKIDNAPLNFHFQYVSDNKIIAKKSVYSNMDGSVRCIYTIVEEKYNAN